MERRHPVSTAHRDRQIARADQRAGKHHVRTQIDRVLKSERQEIAIAVERDLTVERERATMPVTQKNLRACAQPAHRSIEPPSRQHREHMLGIGAGTQTE